MLVIAVVASKSYTFNQHTFSSDPNEVFSSGSRSIPEYEEADSTPLPSIQMADYQRSTHLRTDNDVKLELNAEHSVFLGGPLSESRANSMSPDRQLIRRNNTSSQGKLQILGNSNRNTASI